MTKLVFDFDFLIFDAVSIAEERFITATHKPTGRVMEFPNKTKLWGHHKKKEGGWIAEQNKELGNEYWKPEDFDVIMCQRPKPFKVKGIDQFTGEPDERFDYYISPWDGAKSVLDKKIKAICEKLGTDNYFGYTGKGKTFREDIATLLPYKGNRIELLRPLLLDKMKDYVCQRHSAIMVERLEADDMCNIATNNGYAEWIKNSRHDDYKLIQVSEDKDSKQCSGWHYNPNKDKEPRLIEGFGSLWLNDKDEVDGVGRVFLYYQVASEDTSDNYAANCMSEKKWGSKGAYNKLVDCKNDKQAFEALVDIYKTLYPVSKVVKGWKGDDIEINWLYVLQEVFNLAKMLRAVDEQPTDVKAVLDKLQITY